MCSVPEALGRGASLYEEADDILYPTVPSKWTSFDEVQISEDYLSSGRMPLVDEAIEMLKSRTEGRLAIGGWVLGPFTMAGQLMELDGTGRASARSARKGREPRALTAMKEPEVSIIPDNSQGERAAGSRGTSALSIRWRPSSSPSCKLPKAWRPAVPAWGYPSPAVTWS